MAPNAFLSEDKKHDVGGSEERNRNRRRRRRRWR